LEWWQIVLAVGGGFLAGIINTLAGNGSAITLSILTEVLGLPGGMANGTNRIGVALQTISSAVTFQRAKVIHWKEQARPILLMTIGAFAGIATALWVSNEQFMFVFRYMIVIMLFLLLIKPKRWIQPNPELPKWPRPVLDLSLLAMGFYGGFIQMGMGIFFLAVAVLGARLTLLKANAIKVMVVGIYTVPAIFLFAWEGKIQWVFGLTIGVGQLLGGWLTARYAIRFPQINTWAYYMLIAAVVLAIASLFNLL